MLCSSAALLLSCYASAAVAQVSNGSGSTKQPPAASTADTGLGDDIVVTARRREESLINVPIAITAVTAADLERRQVDSIADVAVSVPNLTYQTGAPTGTGASTPSIFIRGVGSAETSLGTEPGVGLYVDDVYIARSVGSVLDLVDAESIQVLRGPQGTLFGRNSLGGAILIRSRRPGDTIGGYLEAKTGSYSRFDAQGSLDLPLGTTIRTNWTAMYASRDGYIKSADSKAMGNINRIAGRGVIEWQPVSNLRVTLTGDYTRIDERALPGVLLGVVPNIPFTPVPSSIQSVSNLQASCGGASVLGNSGRPGCIDQGSIRGLLNTAGGYSTTNQIFDSQGSRPYGNTTFLKIWGASGSIVYDLSSALTLKSITAYRKLDAFWASNSDHTPNPGIETKNDQDESQFTQEIQLLGKANTLDWVLGAFYMREKGDALNVVAFPDVIFRSGGAFATTSIATFGQASWKVTPRLELTGGLRYTYERKSYDTLRNQAVIGVLVDPVNRVFLDFRAAPIPFVTGATPDLKTNELTPYVNLSYHWSKDVMTYASYSKGYKSGGYEQRLAPGTPTVPYFRPEFVDSFEVGLKATVPGGFTLSAAAFHSKYKDMQISVVDGPSPTLTNAGDATLNGGELELAFRPGGGVTLAAYASYLDAGYDLLTQRALNSGVRLDSALPNVSKWQLGGSFDVNVPLSSELTLRPHADVAWRSDLFIDSANTPLLHQNGYTLLNAALTLAGNKDRWMISVSGRNLLNKIYLVSGIAQYNIGEIEGQVARPREWALSAKIRF